jgi:hypothetical protein
MVQQIGVRPADLRRDGLERYGLGPLCQEQLARRGKRGGPTFFGAEAGSSY